MSSNHAVASHHAHWDTSIWPLVISFGILFMLPLAFAFHFVYHLDLYAVICLGVGVPMIVAGVVGWTKEAIGGGGGMIQGAMGWFILAEAMIFASFFANYWFNRLTADFWPPEATPAIPTVLPAIMTVVLVSSSFTIHYGEEALEHGNRGGFMKWLLITMILGVAFVSMSAYEWNHLFHQGFYPSTNVYGTSFFSITGFHGGHVVVGLLGFVAVLLPALAGRISDGMVKTVSLYWHFVDIIWLFVVSQIYYW